MKKTAHLIIGAALASACMTAMAGENGFYAGVDIGNAAYSSGVNSYNSVVYGATAGYAINKNFGAELQYTGLGNYSGTSTTGVNAGKSFSSNGDAVSLAAVAQMTVMDKLALYGKLGVANTNNLQNHSNGTSGTTSRIDATYGVGVQYAVTPTISARFGWDRLIAGTYSTTTLLTGKQNRDIWALGAVYKF